MNRHARYLGQSSFSPAVDMRTHTLSRLLYMDHYKMIGKQKRHRLLQPSYGRVNERTVCLVGM